MTENNDSTNSENEKRFTLAYEKGNWWAVRDYDITLWKEEVISLLNALHEENQELRMDNDIKFWKHQFMSQYNENQVILHELSLAINKGYEISDKFKKWIEDSAERNKEVMEKNERLFE